MESIVATFIEKVERALTEEQQELLFSLYRTLHMDELHEDVQLSFIDYFCSSDELQIMAAYGLALEGIIHEMGKIVPAIEHEESITDSGGEYLTYNRKVNDAQLQLLKQHTTKQGNVLYVPFANVKNNPSPIIVCLEQTIGMEPFATVCKSMILSLFDEAHRERRTLYIVPYHRHVDVHYRFENGQMHLPAFIDFIEGKAVGEAAMIPVLQFVKELLQEHQYCTEAEILIFTEGVPVDGNRLVEADTKRVIQSMEINHQAEISVVVMQEQNLNEQHFWFANKAFFAEDSI
ncbi:MAG: hypothetical protein RR595_13235 [Lysinibacillus sp.]